MLTPDTTLQPESFQDQIARVVGLSGQKLLAICQRWDSRDGAPVLTNDGTYRSHGWTDWTLGFHFGSALLQYDMTGEERFLEIGREGILDHMVNHLTHTGIHDHGFHTVSTYGNILRLLREERLHMHEWEKRYYELALRVSGAVQAARWTELPGGFGFIHSFNGSHSLFADTIRSLRVLALAHQLGHTLYAEQDERINLFHRLVRHLMTTARWSVYYGEGRDIFDVRGRVAHESLFNPVNGSYRSPGTQQGYSPFTVWMRGLAWMLLGFAEQIEFLHKVDDGEYPPDVTKEEVVGRCIAAATAVADYYIDHVPVDGVPFWDSGAPGLAGMDDALSKPSDPYNDMEPVDSSAAVIAAQGFIRLGRYMTGEGRAEAGGRYTASGLTIANTLFREPYLAVDPTHDGLILHAVYHRPAGWDHVPGEASVPRGESVAWGDYHARELALIIDRLKRNSHYLRFYL